MQQLPPHLRNDPSGQIIATFRKFIPTGFKLSSISVLVSNPPTYLHGQAIEIG